MVKKTKGKNATSKKIKNAGPKLPSSKVDIELTAGSVEPAMKSAEAKSTKLFKVPVSSIQTIPGFNVRIDSADYQAHKAALVQSITENGYDQTKPLAGYVAKSGEGNVIYVTDGHTRLAAVNEINANGGEIATLPVLVHPADKTLTDLTVALHTANSGRPLTPFELGVVVKRLLREEDADKKAIAKRLAITPRYLDDVLLLVNGPKEVRDLVLAGTVSSTLAIQTLRDDPEGAAAKLTTAAEEVAAESGDGKAKKVTAKNVTKTKKLKHEVTVAKGDNLKDINKAIRQAISAALPNSAAGDSAEDGVAADVKATITVIVEIPAPKKKAKSAAAKPKAESTEEAPAEKPAKKSSKKGTAKKGDKAKAKPAAEELGIEGAEQVDDSDIDDEEVAALPPSVGGESDDDDVDI